MDDRFADWMAELGEISSEMLASRWATIVEVADAAGAHEKARLVLLTCRDVLDREADEWFWKPFRAKDDTFRLVDAVETHARLAEAATSYLIRAGDPLTPMLVQLALLSGRSPIHVDLIAESEAAIVLRSGDRYLWRQGKEAWKELPASPR